MTIKNTSQKPFYMIFILKSRIPLKWNLEKLVIADILILYVVQHHSCYHSAHRANAASQTALLYHHAFHKLHKTANHIILAHLYNDTNADPQFIPDSTLIHALTLGLDLGLMPVFSLTPFILSDHINNEASHLSWPRSFTWAGWACRQLASK